MKSGKIWKKYSILVPSNHASKLNLIKKKYNDLYLLHYFIFSLNINIETLIILESHCCLIDINHTFWFANYQKSH